MQHAESSSKPYAQLARTAVGRKQREACPAPASAVAEFVRLNTTKMAAVCHIVAQPSDSSSGARKMPPYACHARSQPNQASDEQRASEGWKAAGGQEAWLPERSSPSALPTSTKTPATGW